MYLTVCHSSSVTFFPLDLVFFYSDVIKSSSVSGDSFVLECSVDDGGDEDPDMTADGQTYERTEIEKWFALGKRTSPLTGEELPSTNLLPNIALRKVIRESGLL